MDLSLLSDRYVIAVLSAAGGIILTVVTQLVLNKRSLFTYSVRHSLVGVSADDAVFGSVRVTWNNNPVANLYSSTVELVNQSMKDHDNVVVRVFSNDTHLLTERTEVVGTIQAIGWTQAFEQLLAIPAGATATQVQMDLVRRQREFLIPTMNRSQVIRFHFLNAPTNQAQPTLWLDVLHRGTKTKFRLVQGEVLGVAVPLASLAGMLTGFVFVGFIIAFVDTLWIAAVLSLVYGFGAQLPGALLLKLLRQIREWLGD